MEHEGRPLNVSLNRAIVERSEERKGFFLKISFSLRVFYPSRASSL